MSHPGTDEDVHYIVPWECKEPHLVPILTLDQEVIQTQTFVVKSWKRQHYEYLASR